MSAWFSEALHRLAGEPLLQGLLAALATFVLEDPTTVGCGLLVADGSMAFTTAMVGVSLGIAIGDAGLYAVGRVVGPAVSRWGLVSDQRLSQASSWLRRNLVLTVLVSRFVPGMRLPTYVGAGILKAPFGRFVLVAVAASVVWTFLLLHLTVALGEAVFPILGRWRWPVAIAAGIILLVVQRRAVRRLRIDVAESEEGPVVSTFEFWPPWLFYLPVALWWAVLSIRYRGVLLPTAANPSIHSGGLIGESKCAILDLVPDTHRQWIAPYVRIDDVRDRDAVRAAVSRAGLSYPMVAKPDLGQRGDGVRPIRSDADLAAYLEAFPVDGTVLLQAMAGEGPLPDHRPDDPRLCDVREAGVMYWRRPGRDSGEVVSITLKRTPEVVGDGRRSVRQLIAEDPRARYLAEIYGRRHAERLDDVLEAGETLPLVFAGNHCQGTVFLDGSDLVNAALTARFDELARAMPEFWFGRFDVRFRDADAFLRGKDFTIIEINGAGGEATHIWDASVRLGEAYRTLFEQFRVLFEIGAANRRRGFPTTGMWAFLRDVRRYRRLSRTYPSTS